MTHVDVSVGIPRRPVNSLHFTLTPRRHVEHVADLSDGEIAAVFTRFRSLAGALRDLHECTGFNLLVNDGRLDLQGAGEVPDEDPFIRFHVFGRRPSEPLAPTTILNDPGQFPLEEVSSDERAARVATVEDAMLTSESPTGPAESPGDCSFCAPEVEHEQELFRDAHARVIRPRNQLIPPYVMVAPLRHVEHLADLTSDEAVSIIRLIGQVATSFGQVHRSTGFNAFANDGKVAGQHVPHVHFHVFGRAEDEELNPYDLLRGMRYSVVRKRN